MINRTVSKDEKVYLPPPKRHSVEELIGYMASDEMIEVTPKSVRLRKEVRAGTVVLLNLTTAKP